MDTNNQKIILEIHKNSGKYIIPPRVYMMMVYSEKNNKDQDKTRLILESEIFIDILQENNNLFLLPKFFHPKRLYLEFTDKTKTPSISDYMKYMDEETSIVVVTTMESDHSLDKITTTAFYEYSKRFIDNEINKLQSIIQSGINEISKIPNTIIFTERGKIRYDTNLIIEMGLAGSYVN